MIYVFIVVAILSAAFSPAAPAPEPEPPEEIRIGDVAKVAEPDEVKDANAPEGYYEKTKYGIVYIPKSAASNRKDAEAIFATFMNNQMAESVAGLALFVSPFILVFRWKARKRKQASEKDMKRISGVSQAEFQAYMRKVNEIAQVLQNVIPDGANAGGKSGGKNKWT